MSLSEQIVVMCNGSVIAQGTPEQVKADATVRSVYLGEDEEA